MVDAVTRTATPRLAIVAPMHNEADGVALFVEQLDEALVALERTHGIARADVEVVVVDDGSTDETAARLRLLEADRRVRVARHATNRGLGAALWTGFGATRADVIVTVDADCTYPLREIADLLALLDADTSIVTASPYHPQGGVEGVPRHRLLLSHTLSRIYRVVLGGGLHTYTAMFRAYRREALATVPVRADGFIAVTHLLVYPLAAGLRVREHPTVLRARRFGTSKLRVLRVIRQHLWLLPGLAWHRLRRARRPRGGPRRSPAPRR